MASPAVYDPLDPATLDDPYPLLAELRRSTPVFWHESTRSWAVTRYADCVAVLRDHQRFARDRRRVGTVVPAAGLSVQSLDPPSQARVRSLFLNALHAQDLDGIQQRARLFLADRFAQFTDADFEVIADVASPLALSVISDLLGVDPPEHGEFAAVSDAIMRSMDAGLDPATVEPGRRARQRLSDLVESWFVASARSGLLAHVRDHLTPGPDDLDLYVRNTARVMFQGGYSTMMAAAGNLAHTLMRHPDAAREMRDPAVLRTGVDELVRFDGPVQGTSRIATVPVDVGGVTVAPGDTVLILFAAANHDPDQFPDPDRLLLRRNPNRHLGYGWGTHACIGTVPAQATLRALVTALLQHPGRLRPAGPPRRRRTATMRTFEALPATFRP